MSTIDELIASPPLLHRDGAGADTSYAPSAETLSFLARSVAPGSRTLETGAGTSTILFALRGTVHTAVSPDRALFERISSFCLERGIPLDGVTLVEEGSELFLPRHELGPLDLVLIDGQHAFPTPFIDWYYTAPALAVGGVVVIDDTQLWTGHVLEQFLLHEPEWSKLASLERAVAFRKIAPVEHTKWWGEQPYLVKATAQMRPLPSAASKVRRALDLVRRGDLAGLWAAVRKSVNTFSRPGMSQA